MRRLRVRLWGEGGWRLIAGDAVVVGLLAAAVGAAALPRGGEAAGAALVEVDGQPAARLDLDAGGLTDVAGPRGVTRIEVRNGAVRVVSSPCPRQVCNHAGWARRPGEALVCLPNALVVRVAGRRPADAPDGVSR